MESTSSRGGASQGMITTAKLANLANLSIFTVRYYTRIGLVKPSRRGENGYKIFKYSDVSTLKFVNNARLLGFALKEIQLFLEMAKQADSDCSAANDIVVRKIAQNGEKIRRLRELLKRLKSLNERWAAADSVPSRSLVYALIESLGRK